VRSISSQVIYRVALFLNLKSMLVRFDPPFHEESEYDLGFYFRPCLHAVNSQKLFFEIMLKSGCFSFYAYSILSQSS